MAEYQTAFDSMARAAEILRQFQIVMFTTVDKQDQSLCSRPMTMLGDDFNGDLWFFSLASAAKVDEIHSDQQVNITAMSLEANRYLSISGVAVLVRDKGRMQELWTDTFLDWFPVGLANPDLALIRVSVTTIEYWDARNRMVPETLNLV
jgi:general stress protein 26